MIAALGRFTWIVCGRLMLPPRQRDCGLVTAWSSEPIHGHVVRALGVSWVCLACPPLSEQVLDRHPTFLRRSGARRTHRQSSVHPFLRGGRAHVRRHRTAWTSRRRMQSELSQVTCGKVSCSSCRMSFRISLRRDVRAKSYSGGIDVCCR